MTKIRKAVLMHSPATGPWFYVGTRAYYWGLSASLSNSNKKIPLRPPPPGFVSAFTLAHAICCWRQISCASRARAEAKMYLDLGKYLAGHSCAGHSGLGQQGESWHCPTTHPTAPSGWHSSKSHLQVQPGSGPNTLHKHPSLGGEFGWVKKWGALPVAGDRSAGQKGHGTLPSHREQHSTTRPPGCCTRASGEPQLDTSHPSHRGWEGSLWETPSQQVAYGADVGRKPLVALKYPSERDWEHLPKKRRRAALGTTYWSGKSSLQILEAKLTTATLKVAQHFLLFSVPEIFANFYPLGLFGSWVWVFFFSW